MEEYFIPTLAPGAAVSFDSLPVLQLRCFPAAPGHDLPFVQGRVCAEAGRSLHLKLASYEVGSPGDSEMSFSVAGLCLTLRPGRWELTLNGCGSEHLALRVTPTDGEDLQGEYWGAVLQLPLAVLRLVLPELTLTRGEGIPFRFEKTRASDGYTACTEDGATFILA